MSRAKKAPAARPNLLRLRERYLDALHGWRALLDAAGVDFYAEAAEGREIGRGKQRAPDELRRAFLAHEAARLAYLGGEGQ